MIDTLPNGSFVVSVTLVFDLYISQIFNRSKSLDHIKVK